MLIKLKKTRMEKSVKLILAIVLVLSVLPFMSAAVTYAGTLVSPIENYNYSTTMLVNVSAQLVNSTTVSYNATLFCNSTGGAMQTTTGGTKVGVIINASELDEWLENKVMSISSITDSVSYNCSAYVDNGTDQEWALGGKAGITFDSTSPSCSILEDHNRASWKGVQELTWASSDALELVSTSVSIDRPEDGSTLAYTDTSRVLTLTSQDTKYLGDWTGDITGTDRAGNTCTAQATWKTYMPGDVPGISAPEDSGKVVLLLIVIGLIIWFAVKKK